MNLKNELENKRKEKNQKQETENHKLKDSHRVIISTEAKVALDQLLAKANDGFEAGEIGKSDLVNMMLLNASKYILDSDLRNLRMQHFDEAKVLGTLLKGINQGEAIPEKLKTFLRGQYGLLETQKKRAVPSIFEPVQESINPEGGERDPQ